MKVIMEHQVGLMSYIRSGLEYYKFLPCKPREGKAYREHACQLVDLTVGRVMPVFVTEPGKRVDVVDWFEEI